jgi:hypothetical protein
LTLISAVSVLAKNAEITIIEITIEVRRPMGMSFNGVEPVTCKTGIVASADQGGQGPREFL